MGATTNFLNFCLSEHLFCFCVRVRVIASKSFGQTSLTKILSHTVDPRTDLVPIHEH